MRHSLGCGVQDFSLLVSVLRVAPDFLCDIAESLSRAGLSFPEMSRWEDGKMVVHGESAFERGQRQQIKNKHRGVGWGAESTKLELAHEGKRLNGKRKIASSFGFTQPEFLRWARKA